MYPLDGIPRHMTHRAYLLAEGIAVRDDTFLELTGPFHHIIHKRRHILIKTLIRAYDHLLKVVECRHGQCQIYRK